MPEKAEALEQRFNRARLMELMEQEDLAAVVSVSPENVTYTSGHHNIDMRVLREEVHAVVWPRQGQPAFLAPDRPNAYATFIDDLRRHPQYGPPEHQFRALADVLSEKGLGSERIGIDLDYLTVRRHRALTEMLPGVTWVDAGEILERVRSIKTPEEIALLRRAVWTTDRAIALAYQGATAADTEKSVADAMGYNVTRFGAEIVAFCILASGPRTPLGHHIAEPVPLERGSIMRCDFGALFGGYCTDLARMASVGRPSRRQRDTYARFLEAHRRTLDAVRPGISGADLQDASVRVYRDLGLPERAMCGHSIGLVLHERPVAAAHETWTIEEGMVMCIENGSTIAEHDERYYIEDTIVVTATGAEVLSNFSVIEEMTIIE